MRILMAGLRLGFCECGVGGRGMEGWGVKSGDIEVYSLPTDLLSRDDR